VLWLDVGHVTGHDDGKPSRVPTVVPQAFIMCIEIKFRSPGSILPCGPRFDQSWAAFHDSITSLPRPVG